MSTYIRESRSSHRDRRDSTSSSDDNVRSTTTVRRYKVTPSRIDREDDYDRRYTRYSNHGRNSGDFLEVDRFKERSYEDSSRSRSAVGDKGRITVWEDKDWDKRSKHRHQDEDLRVEKRFEERFDDSHGHEVERYRKETEYYSQADPAPAPVVIRQRAPEPQRIYVQEAPPPAPIIVPRQDPNIIVLRDRDTGREMVRRRSSYDEDYYYRSEKRDGHRNYEITKWDRRRRDDGGYDSDDDYYVKKTVVRRDRSESPHHKRYLAEGALAGAGITALLSSRRDANGDVQDNRGRKVLAGAALGALGTEAVRRAHSAYEDRWGDRDESPNHHSRLKTGLGIAAVALAAAGAAKYLDTNKAEKEEAARGRSRRRGHSRSSSYSRSRSYSRSHSRPKSKKRSLSRIGKAALGTVAALGVAKKLHDRSKSRGRSRSKSKLRRAAELGAGAAAVGIGAKAWKHHQKKKKERERSRGLSEDGSDYRGASRSHSRSRSRSRSQARSHHSDAGADRELGLVEYGDDPLVPEQQHSYPDERAYESEAEARRERRRRRRDRDRSASGTEDEGRDGRNRSRSKLRDMAAAGAAAIGIKEYKDKKDAERKSRERRSRERDQDRRRSRDDRPSDGYFDNQGHPPSPPNASGGAYYPPYPQTPGGSGTFYQQPNAPHNGEYQPYVPQDYTGYPPPPPGPPPMSGANGTGYQPPPPPGPPPAGGHPPDHTV